MDALLKGQAAVASGDIDAASRWFGRSLRLAPGDPSATLGLAVCRLRQGSQASIEFFQDVAKNHDVREAWVGLATACRIHGHAHRAAQAAARALSRHAFPRETYNDFDAIAREAGLPGWCALDGKRRLLARILVPVEPKMRLVAGLSGMKRHLALPGGDDPASCRFPPGWEVSGLLSVQLDSLDLMGSPIDLNAITQLEGFADTKGGDLHGWAWHPNDPERDPVLKVVPIGSGEPVEVVARDRATTIAHGRPLAQPRAFRVPSECLAGLKGPVRLIGQQGFDLIGSPLDPFAEQQSALAASTLVANLFPSGSGPTFAPATFTMPAAPAAVVGPPPVGGSQPRSVDVVIPVYGGYDLTLACLASVLDGLPDWARVVVVDARAPDPRLSSKLVELAQSTSIRLIRQPVNGGFPKAANAGMRHDLTRDVVLLNSDTLVPPGWLPTLRTAAYEDSSIGSATPFSNDATIMSYPSVEHVNDVPTLAEVKSLDAMARRANPRVVIDLPTAIGFCVYIKRDCLNDTGLLREDRFAQGYCEENDFSIRARHLGWRHVGVPRLYVGHVGSQSFRATKSYLIDRNLRFLNQLHPGYDAMVQEFKRADPLAGSRKRLDIQRWRSMRKPSKSVLLVTHGRGGGVQKHVAARAAYLRRHGLRPIVLWPVASLDGKGRDCVIGDGPRGGTPNLRYSIPRELKGLAALLGPDQPVRAEVHHLVGHDDALLDLFALLQIPYEIFVHDYSWFCTRINLMRADKRYCGEPSLDGCEACFADDGSNLEDDIRPTELVEQSSRHLAGATRVVVPSEDVFVRMQRHFSGLKLKTINWENDDVLIGRAPIAQSDRRPTTKRGNVITVCVVGAIGYEKGYDYLLACVRDARKKVLPLHFIVVGFTCDDARLLDAGPISITGRYDEAEAVDLIRSQSADVGLLTSLWPETWCYTLTQMWRAGLDVVAFDLGTPAERINKTGRGYLVPLGLPPDRMNTLLLEGTEARIALHQGRPLPPVRTPEGVADRISSRG